MITFNIQTVRIRKVFFLITALIIISETAVISQEKEPENDSTTVYSEGHHIAGDELNKYLAGSFNQQLEGRVSGVFTTTSGEPGEGTSVRIRGMNSIYYNDPLYIIDGIAVEDPYQTAFNSLDIESIEILKGGKASIYGIRGANGVIIVKTKKGLPGKVKVNYQGSVGIQKTVNNMDYLISDPKDYSEYYYRLYDNALIQNPNSSNQMNPRNPYSVGRGQLPTYTYPYPDAGVVEANYSYPDSLIFKANHAGTNWFDEVFDPAMVTEHNVSVSGGTKKFSAYFSSGYQDQNGTALHTYLKRYSTRLNTELKLGPLTLGENISFVKAKRNGPDDIAAGNQSNYGIINWITQMHPLTPVYDISGENFAGGKSPGMGIGRNPVAELYRNRNNELNTNRLLTNIYIRLEPVKNLKLSSDYGVDNTSTNQDKFIFPNPEHYEPRSEGGKTITESTIHNWNWNSTLSYEITIKSKVKLGALIGYEKTSYDYGGKSEIFNSGTLLASQQSNTTTEFTSLYEQVNFNYDDIILLNGSVRTDYYPFTGNTKFVTFPSFDLSFRVSELLDVPWIDNLSLGYSYGKLGNRIVPPFNSYYYPTGSVGDASYDISTDSGNNGYALLTGSPNRKQWGQATSNSLVFDGAFFQKNLEFNLELYKRKTVDLIEMQNTGLDARISYVSKRKKISSKTTLIFSSYRNEIIGEAPIYTIFDNSRIGLANTLQKGYPISSFYGFTVDGIFSSQEDISNSPQQGNAVIGGFRWKDINNDRIIDNEDRGVIGNPHPKFTFGLNEQLSYKNIDLSILLIGSIGNDIFNYNKLYDTYGFFSSNVRKEVLTDSFHPIDNPDGNLPMLGLSGYTSDPSSFYVENGSYVRLRTLEIGYTFTSGFLSKFTDYFRVYVRGQNLITITKYSGLDPALSNFGIQNTDKGNSLGDLWYGYDLGNYPTNKLYMIGVNATF